MDVRTVQANALRMNVATCGIGPAVLLCHGFPETHHAWRGQMQPLADAGFQAVAPDLRGFGATEAPASADRYGLMEVVGDMIDLLDAMEVHDAVIVGNDWGASLAWQAVLMRPDRFRAVVALGVPMMGRAPAPPTTLFPSTREEEPYVLYFQREGDAEAELEADISAGLRKIVFAASGDAGPRQPGDGTPNPFGMVSPSVGLLRDLPTPTDLPPWITEGDLATFASAFGTSGFRGGLNYYRNLDRNWQDQAALTGLMIRVPALFMVGDRDTGLAIPGMRDMIAAMPGLISDLRGTVYIPGAGHWLPQERPDEVNAHLLAFLKDVVAFPSRAEC